MNLILIYCLLLFVIYLGIVGLLVYYFFSSRDTWNIILKEIYQDLESLVNQCTRHNILGLFIPGFIYSSPSDGVNSRRGVECRDCIKEEKTQQSNLYNVQILNKIYTLIKTIDANILEDFELSSRCKIIQFLLEYIIRNYQELSDADYLLYERLQATYQLATSSTNSKLSNSSILKGIEIITFLEEYSKVFDNLDLLCKDINIEMINGTFMIGFYQDLKKIIINAKTYLSEFIT